MTAKHPIRPNRVVKAYTGAQIHDGHVLHHNHALVQAGDGSHGILPVADLLQNCPTQQLTGGVISPGFVDVQVNGGGGVMFNDDPSVHALRIIARAHAALGTHALLPTLITDTPDRTRAAIDAVKHAISERVEGIVGLHLEGPHLSLARKGAHDPQLIRPMTDEDLTLLLRAAEHLPNLMVTVAPENTTLTQIKAMADAGIVVSLGHTDADYETCHAAFDAGATCVTHLFNAMSQFASRAPGLVGATLERGDIYAGLIADGLHVHPATIRVALAAKPLSERVFLVTDAMATAGSDANGFLLNGRKVIRENHRLTLSDGTLAGADLDMSRAVSVMINEVKEGLATAVPRATATPSTLLRENAGLGCIGNGSRTALYFENGFSNPITLRAETS